MKPRVDVEGGWRVVRRKVLARDLARCVGCGRGLDADTLQAHHRKARSGGRDDSPANVISTCVRCHGWAHAHPREARDIGWIVPSWGDPYTTPVQVRDGVWWLRPDGSRDPVAEGPFPLSNVSRDATRNGENLR